MPRLSETPRALSIVIPAYNEEARLDVTVSGVIAAAERVLDAYEVIIVNDGSRDRTADVANALASTHPNTAVLHHTANRGVGAAYSSALQVARYAYLTLVPGDHAFEDDCLAAFFSTVGQADMIISYRDNPAVRTPIRRLLSIACTATLRLATGAPLRDGHSLYIWSVARARRIAVPSDYRYHLTTLCALLMECSSYAQIPVRLTAKPDASSRVLRPKVVFRLGSMMLRIVVRNNLRLRRLKAREIVFDATGCSTDRAASTSPAFAK